MLFCVMFMLCYVVFFSILFCSVLLCYLILSYRDCVQARSQPVFSGKPGNDFAGPFCLSCTFIFRNEVLGFQKNW